MPEIDGLEATRQLRAQPATAHLPIIALTAAVLDAERAQAHAAGMNGFVSKPAGEGDLLRALWAYLPGRARGRRARSCASIWTRRGRPRRIGPSRRQRIDVLRHRVA